MNMDVIKSFTEQMQGFAAPSPAYNQLLASNIEQLTRLQLVSANAYAELGLNQLQAVGRCRMPRAWRPSAPCSWRAPASSPARCWMTSRSSAPSASSSRKNWMP